MMRELYDQDWEKAQRHIKLIVHTHVKKMEDGRYDDDDKQWLFETVMETMYGQGWSIEYNKLPGSSG